MNFNLPTKINYGYKCLESFTINQDYKKVLLLTSKTFLNNRYINQTIIKKLDELGIQYQPMSIVKGEPTSKNIDLLFDKLDKNVELIIAYGGGSVMDTAKFLSVIQFTSKTALEYDFNQIEIDKALPLILIPTTAGSGSDVTPYAVASNSETGRKFTIYSEKIFPRSSYIDSSFLKSLSKENLIYPALDAFIHSLEAILNNNKNILIYEFALQSMKIIYSILNKDLERLNESDLEKLTQASLYGGICIANSRTGMIHTFSVAVSEYSYEAHGLLNSKLLKNILTFNLDRFNGILSSIISQVTNEHVLTDSDALNLINQFIKKLISNDKIQVKRKPSIEYIADRVLQDGGLQNVNIKPYTRDDLINITKGLKWQD